MKPHHILAYAVTIIGLSLFISFLTIAAPVIKLPMGLVTAVNTTGLYYLDDTAKLVNVSSSNKMNYVFAGDMVYYGNQEDIYLVNNYVTYLIIAIIGAALTIGAVIGILSKQLINRITWAVVTVFVIVYFIVAVVITQNIAYISYGTVYDVTSMQPIVIDTKGYTIGQFIYYHINSDSQGDATKYTAITDYYTAQSHILASIALLTVYVVVGLFMYSH